VNVSLKGYEDQDMQLDGRSGSYAFNTWLWGELSLIPDFPEEDYYKVEGDIVQPSFTPVLADSVFWYGFPRATDPPPSSLVYGHVPSDLGHAVGFIGFMSLPRHGSQPNRIPKAWPSKQPLPGAINVSFFDGHAELVRAERLWQLYWHKDYQPPPKRPGLP